MDYRTKTVLQTIALCSVAILVLVGAFLFGFVVGKANAQGYQNTSDHFEYTTENGSTDYSIYCYTDSSQGWSGCVKKDGTLQIVQTYKYLDN